MSLSVYGYLYGTRQDRRTSLAAVATRIEGRHFRRLDGWNKLVEDPPAWKDPSKWHVRPALWIPDSIGQCSIALRTVPSKRPEKRLINGTRSATSAHHLRTAQTLIPEIPSEFVGAVRTGRNMKECINDRTPRAVIRLTLCRAVDAYAGGKRRKSARLARGSAASADDTAELSWRSEGKTRKPSDEAGLQETVRFVTEVEVGPGTEKRPDAQG